MISKIVTAYWMDVEGMPYQGAYPVRKQRYLGSLIAHCQNLKLPVVCYTHSKSIDELEKVKKDYQLENLQIKILELNEIMYHERIEKIRKSNIEKYNRELDGRGCEIMWGKFDLLERELNDCKFLYWLDAGLQHPGLFRWSMSKKYNSLEDHHNPHHMKSWWTEYDVYNFPNFFNDKIFDKLNKICENKICFITSHNPQIHYPNDILNSEKKPFLSPYPVGAMVGGNSDTLKKYLEYFRFFAEKILDNNMLCTEEVLMKPAFDKMNNDELLYFTFNNFHCCEHDKFHFEMWNDEWKEPKPFYMVWYDILNYNIS